MLKLLAVGQFDDDDINIMIIPPCAGHYTNMSLQFMQLADADDPVHIAIGPQVKRDAMDALADTVFSVMTVLPDIQENAFYINMQFVQEEDAGAIQAVQTKHWGNKKVYIDDDDYLHFMMRSAADGGSNGHFILQGDFIPNKGALYKFEHLQVDFDGSGGLTNLPIPILVSLDNVVIDIALHGDTTQVAAEGVFQLYIFERDEDVELAETTFSGTIVGDVLETMPTGSHMKHNKNLIGSWPISFVSGGKNLITGRVQLPAVFAGQVFMYDFALWEGAIAALDVKINMQGIVKFRHYSNDADFLEGSGYFNHNKERAGG